jgi:hypothetical protein
MDVIGHQHGGVKGKLAALPVVLHSLEVVYPVPIVAEDFLALIAPDDHVVKRPFEFYPRLSGHSGRYTS